MGGALVDSHCHLDAPEFADDRDAVIARARASGVSQQVIPAINSAGWPALKALCDSNTGLFPAYGLHPMFLQDHQPQHLIALGDWLQREKPVAVGECGLDYFVGDLDQDQQNLYFGGQLALAREFDLPLILHARRAVDAAIAAIKRVGALRGVVHSFSGSPEQARQLWNLGFLLGIGGPVTYERAQRLRSLVAEMPLEFLLLETDSPDQPDAQHIGQRNEPARLSVVCETVATLRGIDADQVAAATSENARRLFRLPPP
ncbi:MAG: TatD family deoxyribonuclease [Burkholderiales bacterium]|nr:MAG: TatD family deoxyribonuclease [Burkholderiales bacterium]